MKNVVGKKLNLVGQKFGRLTVLEKVADKIDLKSGKHKSQFLCQCDCGNQKIVLGSALTQGSIRSCGCLHRETASIVGKKKKGKSILHNKYNLNDYEYGVGYTLKGEEFYFDKEDYELIKDVYWHKTDRGYIRGLYQGKKVSMHRLIMGVLDDKTVVVDHRNPNTYYDNRRQNLRITTQANNTRNRSIGKSNTSGVLGVHKNNKGKYIAYIRYKGKQKALGEYNTLEEAALRRRLAELAYFGEYAVKNGFNRKDGKQYKEFVRHGIFHTF